MSNTAGLLHCLGLFSLVVSSVACEGKPGGVSMADGLIPAEPSDSGVSADLAEGLETGMESGVDAGVEDGVVGRPAVSPTGERSPWFSDAADAPGAVRAGLVSDALAYTLALTELGIEAEDARVAAQVLVDPAEPHLRTYVVDGHAPLRVDLRVEAAPVPGWTWAEARAAADSLDLLAASFDSADGEPIAPPTCSATCGRDDRSSYAGWEAYSNGSSTGTGVSCAGGDSYQCTQGPDKVHRHYGTTYGSNWTGDAYTGYLGSTGAAAFGKGLIPFAPGSAYDAPLDGDVLVWSGGSYGHVGVISSVASSYVRVLDQNRACGDQSCKLTYSRSGSTHTLANGSGTDYCGSEGLSGLTLLAYERRGWDFSGAFGTTGWTLNQARYTTGTTSGSRTDLSDYIELEATGSDPYIVSPSGQAITAYSSSATYGYNKVVIRAKSDCSNKNLGFYWKPLGGSFSATNKVNGTLSGTGWNTLTLSLSGASGWSGIIDQIRIDPSESGTSGCKAQIQYLYFDR